MAASEARRSSWDDRFTAYTAEAVAAAGLDGGNMMVRIHDNGAGTLRTLVSCADAISALAADDMRRVLTDTTLATVLLGGELD